MTEENPPVEGDEYDPSEHTANEVKAELAEASEEEKLRIAAAEMADRNRKSVVAAAGIPEGTRLDATGRRLNPWEVAPVAAEGAEEA